MRYIQVGLIVCAVFIAIAGLVALISDYAWATSLCVDKTCGEPCFSTCLHNGVLYWIRPYSECPTQPPGKPVWCTY